METGMTLGDPTPDFNYHSPFMMCSSFEETVKTIPDVGSMDEWTTMIIHEYFHGFQYKHKPYMDYYENEIVQIQPDSLTTFYKKLLGLNNQSMPKTSYYSMQLLKKIVSKQRS
jgi:hypothetical protein